MSGPTSVPAPGSGASSEAAKSRRERLKLLAVANIHTAAEKTGNAAVTAIEYCHEHREACRKGGAALGAIGGGALGTAISSETGFLTAPVVTPVTIAAGGKIGGMAAECAVDGCHNHVAPLIPDCFEATANCSGKVAERSIDCGADSAETCAQGTRNLTDRVTACF